MIIDLKFYRSASFYLNHERHKSFCMSNVNEMTMSLVATTTKQSFVTHCCLKRGFYQILDTKINNNSSLHKKTQFYSKSRYNNQISYILNNITSFRRNKLFFRIT